MTENTHPLPPSRALDLSGASKLRAYMEVANAIFGPLVLFALFIAAAYCVMLAPRLSELSRTGFSQLDYENRALIIGIPVCLGLVMISAAISSLHRFALGFLLGLIAVAPLAIAALLFCYGIVREALWPYIEGVFSPVRFDFSVLLSPHNVAGTPLLGAVVGVVYVILAGKAIAALGDAVERGKPNAGARIGSVLVSVVLAPTIVWWIVALNPFQDGGPAFNPFAIFREALAVLKAILGHVTGRAPQLLSDTWRVIGPMLVASPFLVLFYFLLRSVGSAALLLLTLPPLQYAAARNPVPITPVAHVLHLIGVSPLLYLSRRAGPVTGLIALVGRLAASPKIIALGFALIGGALVAASVAADLIGFGSTLNIEPSSVAASVFMIGIGLLLSVGVGFLVSVICNRLAPARAESVMRKDQRAPILLLRPFKHGRLHFPQTSKIPSPWRPDDAPRGLDELIANLAGAYGPVVSIARPEDRYITPFGASRLRVGDGDWQSRVKALAEQSQLIIFAIDENVTPGLAFEMDLVQARQLEPKTAFIHWSSSAEGQDINCHYIDNDGVETALSAKCWRNARATYHCLVAHVLLDKLGYPAGAVASPPRKSRGVIASVLRMIASQMFWSWSYDTRIEKSAADAA